MMDSWYGLFSLEKETNVKNDNYSTIMFSLILFFQTGAITCSSDTTAKVWKFDLVKLEGSKAKVLSVLHTRTLKLDDQVLAVKQSPCGKFIAAALLDSTVKIFFTDTFKVSYRTILYKLIFVSHLSGQMLLHAVSTKCNLLIDIWCVPYVFKGLHVAKRESPSPLFEFYKIIC